MLMKSSLPPPISLTRSICLELKKIQASFQPWGLCLFAQRFKYSTEIAVFKLLVPFLLWSLRDSVDLGHLTAMVVLFLSFFFLKKKKSTVEKSCWTLFWVYSLITVKATVIDFVWLNLHLGLDDTRYLLCGRTRATEYYGYALFYLVLEECDIRNTVLMSFLNKLRISEERNHTNSVQCLCYSIWDTEIIHIFIWFDQEFNYFLVQ